MEKEFLCLKLALFYLYGFYEIIQLFKHTLGAVFVGKAFCVGNTLAVTSHIIVLVLPFLHLMYLYPHCGHSAYTCLPTPTLLNLNVSVDVTSDRLSVLISDLIFLNRGLQNIFSFKSNSYFLIKIIKLTSFF